MHAIAACLAVVIMLNFFLFPFSSADHSFSIKANAQTLVSDIDFTPITDITASQMGFTGTDWAEIAGVLNLSENNTEDIKITNEAFFLVNDSTYTDKNTHEKYEKYEVYDYTVKLCAKII